jgi:cephalosporin hydroxylase
MNETNNINYEDFPDAFANDRKLIDAFKTIFEEYNPDIIVETGTFKGSTTSYFASFGVPVITTEINPDFQAEAKEKYKHINNITFWTGDSAEQISNNINLIQDKKIIFFLDAHWQNDKALERELAVISKLSIKPFIIIHDFQVPNTSLGYDTYADSTYSYDFFKSYIDNIYGIDSYVYYYNDDTAEGGKRGVIFLSPK